MNHRRGRGDWLERSNVPCRLQGAQKSLSAPLSALVKHIYIYMFKKFTILQPESIVPCCSLVLGHCHQSSSQK